MPFALGRAKLLRAGQFITELELELADYVASKPLSVVLEPPNVRIQQQGIRLKPSVIVGDAVHAMRAALDLMAVELVKLSDLRTDSEKVYFPFGSDEQNFEDRVVKTNFYKAGDDAVALLRTFRPYYKAGDAMLRAIHDLDIKDKHSGIELSHTQNQAIIRGRYALDGSFPPVADVELEGFKYVFPPDLDGLADRPVIETLKTLAEKVGGILDAFELLIISRPRPTKLSPST